MVQDRPIDKSRHTLTAQIPGSLLTRNVENVDPIISRPPAPHTPSPTPPTPQPNRVQPAKNTPSQNFTHLHSLSIPSLLPPPTTTYHLNLPHPHTPPSLSRSHPPAPGVGPCVRRPHLRLPAARHWGHRGDQGDGAELCVEGVHRSHGRMLRDVD